MHILNNCAGLLIDGSHTCSKVAAIFAYVVVDDLVNLEFKDEAAQL